VEEKERRRYPGLISVDERAVANETRLGTTKDESLHSALLCYLKEDNKEETEDMEEEEKEPTRERRRDLD